MIDRAAGDPHIRQDAIGHRLQEAAGRAHLLPQDEQAHDAHNSPEQEMSAALDEIFQIAELRLRDLIRS